MSSVTSSGVLSPAPPEDQALFGYPPLLGGEDIGFITDHSWEIRRTAPLQGPLY
jgi:hypothetical protein